MRSFESAPPDLHPLLSRRISELGLKLEGSPVERHVETLYRELAKKDLRHFRPLCYLTDEWGCPSGEPIIGIPFYLANPELSRLEKEIDDLEDEREILMYLRHEAGHAFNYAYRLYETEEWREIFGPFNRPYRDHYRPVPFDRSFVRHMEGWYAQKHPDEDFAETFAVWLTPGSRWRVRYRGWPAMVKLRYVDRVVRSVRDVVPPVRIAATDVTVEEMDMTVEEFFRSTRPDPPPVDVPVDTDLPDLFPRRKRGRNGTHPAHEMIDRHRSELIDKIEYWTGVRRFLVTALVDRIRDAAERLRLGVDARGERAALVELTAYATTLAMNHLTSRSFSPSKKRRKRKTSPSPPPPARKEPRDDGRERSG